MTLWTIAHLAPLSIGFPRQEYWSGLPFPPPGDLPDSGIEPVSPELAGRFFTTGPPGKPLCIHRYAKIYDNFQDVYGIIIKEVRSLELYF